MTSGAMSRVTNHVTCQGTRTRGGGEVVDDEPTRGGVVGDERCDEPRDEPHDVQRHQDARRRRSSRRQACARRSSRRRACATQSSRRRAARRADAPGRAAEAK
jgi:hypothetical protein